MAAARVEETSADAYAVAALGGAMAAHGSGVTSISACTGSNAVVS